MKKLLTIGIPNYNGGNYLQDTILSCQNLDLTQNEYEILVIDNCSTDNSVEVVKNLQKEINNIRLIVNDKNYGRVGNWNRIIDFAESKFLMFLMCKDVLIKSNIKENLENRFLDKETHYVFQSGYFDENGKVTKFVGKNSFYGEKLTKEFVFKNRFEFFGRKMNYVSLTTNIFDVDLLKDKNIKFDDTMSYRSDEKLITQYYNNFKNIIYLDSCLYAFNANDSNRFTYKNIRELYFDAVKLNDYYYNIILGKKYGRLKSNYVIFLHMLSVYFFGKIKKMLGHKNIPEMKVDDTKKFFLQEISNKIILFYLSFILLPLYIAYYYINVLTNFKFFIKIK